MKCTLSKCSGTKWQILWYFMFDFYIFRIWIYNNLLEREREKPPTNLAFVKSVESRDLTGVPQMPWWVGKSYYKNKGTEKWENIMKHREEVGKKSSWGRRSVTLQGR